MSISFSFSPVSMSRHWLVVLVFRQLIEWLSVSNCLVICKCITQILRGLEFFLNKIACLSYLLYD